MLFAYFVRPALITHYIEKDLKGELTNEMILIWLAIEKGGTDDFIDLVKSDMFQAMWGIICEADLKIMKDKQDYKKLITIL